MNFGSVNKFNVFINHFSGNCLPVTSTDNEWSVWQKIFSTISFLYQVVFFIFQCTGFIARPTLKSMQGGFLNMSVVGEAIFLMIYMNSKRNKLQSLVGRINILLSSPSEILETNIDSNISFSMKLLKCYVVASTSSAMIFGALPIFLVFSKNTFNIDDLCAAMNFFTDDYGPYSFIAIVIFQVIGFAACFLKKVAVDIYLIHVVKLLISVYTYLRYELSNIFHKCKNEKHLEKRLKDFMEQQEIIISIAQDVPQIFSINVGLLYITGIIKFCFLGFMGITITGDYVSTILVTVYACGGLFDMFILCSGVHYLQEVSSSVTDEAFYESWYNMGAHLRKIFKMITLSKSMECRLSTSDTIGLTLPFLKSILSSSYSACLLLLKVK